jgi:pimeloyl-ACP methyl ester carboxylesterase
MRSPALETTTTPAPDETRVALPSAGFSTRVIRAGAGSPVLLLHGNPDSAGEWRPAIAALRGAGACLAPDLPGFGACDEPPPSFDYSRAAHDRFLDELLDALDVCEKIVLAVHDIGGVVGIPWAARHLDRIRGVLITNTVIFEGFPWFGIARTWARTDLLGRARAEAGMWAIGQARGLLFRRSFGRISPELDADDLARMNREFALDAKSKRSTLRLFRQMLRPEFFAGADAAVRALIAHVPVRVLWGLGDPYIPARYADSFPGAQRVILARGGHWVPISSADRVAEAIQALLAD